MNNEEFKKFVKMHDRKVGIYKPTIKLKDKRDERLGNVPDKVLFMAQELINRGVDFQVYEALCRKYAYVYCMLTDIYIPEYNIAMRYIDMDDENSVEKGKFFYESIKHYCHAFMIRSTEDNEFLVKKLDGCIEKGKTYVKKGLNTSMFVLERQKRKRIEK